MNKMVQLTLGSFLLFAIDRITKLWALNLGGEWAIHKNLSCALVLNRGVNWGLFNSTQTLPFIFLTLAIGVVIVMLLTLAISAAKQGKSIVGYLLILTGAFSNFIDRIFCGGVIDFIIVWFGDWSWPAFNIADVAILAGIALLIKDNFVTKR